MLKDAPRKTFVVSLENRKRRGCGHERAAEILTAARELFLEHGVENVSTRQIAARVGISQTALYVYFCNKEQMLDALAEETWKALGAELDGAAHEARNISDSVERLRALLVTFMRFWLARPDDHRIIFMRKALRPTAQGELEIPEKTGAGQKWLARLTDGVETAVKAGAIRHFRCSATTALSIWAAITGLITLRLVYPNFPWPPEDAHIEATLDMIFNGCAVPANAAARR